MHTRMNSAFSLVEKDCMLFRPLELGWKIERKWCLNHLICMGSSCCESVGVHRLLVNADYLQGTVIASFPGSPCAVMKTFRCCVGGSLGTRLIIVLVSVYNLSHVRILT